MVLRKILFLLIAGLQTIYITLHAEDIYAPVPVYQQIADIYHPTLMDYKLIQQYLTFGERSVIERLDDYKPNARNFKIIGDSSDEVPQSGLVSVNCKSTDRDNCVVLYASFNKNYVRGLKRLLKLISSSDFKGHVLYHIGGWPDVVGGSLVLAHVPYAFKVASLKEAKELGFKRAFWLDTAIVPYVSLNTIFSMIKKKGYFVMGNSHMIGPYTHPDVANAFGMPFEETYQIPSCSAGITGVDFTNEKGRTIFERWYQAANNPVAFFSPRSDQNALSIILYQMGISDDLISIERLAHNKNQIRPDTLLIIEREYVNELSMGN